MLYARQEQVAQYETDTLIFRQIAVNVLLDLHDTATRLLADAGRNSHADADALAREKIGSLVWAPSANCLTSFLHP